LIVGFGVRKLQLYVNGILTCSNIYLDDDYETSVSVYPLGSKRHLEVVLNTASSSKFVSSMNIITVGDDDDTITTTIAEYRFDDLRVSNHLVASDYLHLTDHISALI